jgi:hypothetical protein
MSIRAFMIQCFQAINKRSSTFSLILFSLLVFLLSFSACKNDEINTGLDLLPTNGQLNSIVADTFSIVSYSVKADSVKTDSLSTNILGAINDPEFGISAASLYAQFLLPEINLNYGVSPKLDSCVLVLRYGSANPYGNLNSQQKVNFYKINDALKPEASYYQNTPIALGDKIGSFQGVFSPNDSVLSIKGGDTVQLPPQLRVKLDNSFGNELINAPASVYGSNTSFLNYLKGIAMVPASGSMGTGNGAIVNINLLSIYTELVVYYNDSLKKSFQITGESERVQNYNFPQRSSGLQEQLNNPGTNRAYSYVQAMSGAKTKIEIPHLKNLVQDGRKVIIQEASITFFPVAGSVSTTYPAPARFFLFQPDSATGKNVAIIDLVDYLLPPVGWTGYTNYGGTYDANTGSVTFHFNRHLQNLLDQYLITGQDINKGFFLSVPSDFPITPGRFYMDNTKTKVKIIYTKL